MNKEHKVTFKEAACIQACWAGPMPSTDVNMEDIPEFPGLFDDGNDDSNDEPYAG